MNTDGGTLIIGVEDSGDVYGLENDLRSVQGSKDKYLQLLYRLVSDYIGPQFGTLVKTRFEPLNGSDVCVVDVDKGPEPVFVVGSKGKEFFIRVGNATRALDPEQTVSYTDSNWA